MMSQANHSGNATQQMDQWSQSLAAVLDQSQHQRFGAAFSWAYQQDFSVDNALNDVGLVERLDSGANTAMQLYRDDTDDNQVLRFRFMRSGELIALSDVLPLLESFGLRVIGEKSYELHAGDCNYWLHVFELHHRFEQDIDVDSVAPAFERAFQQVWNRQAETDAFNQLVLGVRMDWRTVAMLRAYARYMKQINLNFARPFIANTLVHHLDIASNLATLFDQRFNPLMGDCVDQRQADCDTIVQSIVACLDTVENLNEDKVIRQYLTLMNATLRTNFYQRDDADESEDEAGDSYLSFKLNVHAIPEAPQPRPMFETFVYSPRVEGVHLRGGKVARGGLRWSDRQEDFRTEVLGLVKAQQVKNSVIVPMGAKGGFVCKQAHDQMTREEFQNEGVACYQLFISALLDLADNRVDGDIAPPENVVRWDDDDPYLVVAADKGTATFSDIANALSEKYGFWLGDAFASGGSVGYDHKKMGITAKGAWVSVQRHFREMGLDVQNEEFTVVGVGDMAGDVFGNGLLSSDKIRMVAAFNHLHIFIDPNPDAAAGFAERQRLFTLPRSSWEDYNAELISSGGGIFSRFAKSIDISAEMQKRFAIEADQLTPNELIRAILLSEYDLFWNGGIGTYVKASSELDADVGDKANDSVRVNANELKVRVIGEGGNLGITQRARSEFGLCGGRCNTDFIDNAGGVDCSDHEVNIKILLDRLVAEQQLDQQQRNSLLESMTDDVSALVLANNYAQTQAISIAEYEAHQRAIEYRRLVTYYESLGRLDRTIEHIPSDEELAERKGSDQSMTRAELSVLISYTKLLLKEQLAASDIDVDPYLAPIAHSAFPAAVGERFGTYIDQHPLHSELVATQIAGDLVNRMGIAFVHRMQQATGENEATIAKAYVAVRDVFAVEAQWRAIEALDYHVSSAVQHEMFAQLIRLVRRATRWLLRSRRAGIDPALEVKNFAAAAEYLAQHVTDHLDAEQKAAWQKKVAAYVEAGVPGELASFVAGSRYYYAAFAITEIAEKAGRDIDYIASCYFALGEALELNWFGEQIVQMGVENYWQAMARESFRDELEEQHVELTVRLACGYPSADIAEAIDTWFTDQSAYVDRWQQLMGELRCVPDIELAMFPVAIRELLDLSQASQRAA